VKEHLPFNRHGGYTVSLDGKSVASRRQKP
jgi:hypothetical protein